MLSAKSQSKVDAVKSFRHFAPGTRNLAFDEVAWFNTVEAAWWLLVAVLVAVEGHRSRRPRGLVIALTLAFVLFSISDVIEIQTGAWWRPTWLAVLKFGCGGAIVLLALRLWQAR